MAAEIDYKFGAAEVAGKPNWLVQSSSKTRNAQSAMALDNVGEPKKIHFYQKTTEMSFEVIIPIGDSTFPEIGDTFTLEGVGYYVQSVSIAETNTDFVRYTLSCIHFDTANLPTAGA